MTTLHGLAQQLVEKDRASTYGPPEHNLGATAEIWTGLLHYKLQPGARITSHEVALLMVGLKLSRESYQHKTDNLVDAHGYLHIAERLAPHAEGG